MSSVKYGATVTLQHVATKRFLNSPAKPYVHPGTSGQDQVTCSEDPLPSGYWILKPPHGYPDDFAYSLEVKNGDIVRLENRASQKNLHSHGDRTSPLSQQQEVTCFGTAGKADINDNWKVEFSGDIWNTDSEIRLIHTLTNAALHSHGDRFDAALTSAQQEVTGYHDRDNNDLWTVSTMASPLTAPQWASNVFWRRLFVIFNALASIASISGITFIFIGASVQTATAATLLSIVFASLLFLGVFSCLAMGSWELYRLVCLRSRNPGWRFSFWLLGVPVIIYLSALSWRFTATHAYEALYSILKDIFLTK